jgi:hypothetical protein
MAMQALDLPEPAGHPYHFWLDPQQRFLDSLDLPAIPLVRPHRTDGSLESLLPTSIKIVYVSRQETSRRLDDGSDRGLQNLLKRLAVEPFRRADGSTVSVVAEMVRFEHMSVREQIETAYDADVSVSSERNQHSPNRVLSLTDVRRDRF